MRVPLVEDDADRRLDLAVLLRGAGLAVDEAVDDVTADILLDSHDFDVAVVATAACPTATGLNWCAAGAGSAGRCRSSSSPPVLEGDFVAEGFECGEVVAGLAAGADALVVEARARGRGSGPRDWAAGAG